MRLHVIFVEPAPYTLDLIDNVYRGDEHTFLYKKKEAIHQEAFKQGDFIVQENTTLAALTYFLKLAKNIDVVIINGYTHWVFFYLFFLSLIYGFIIGIESDTPFSRSHGLRKYLKSSVLRMIFSRPNVFGLAGGGQGHRRLFTHYGMDNKRVLTMPMCVDNEKFYRKAKKSIGSTVRFLFVGRFIEEKNLSFLLSTWLESRLLRNHELILVGEGPLDNELRSIANNHYSVIFKGKLTGESLVNIYHSCDVLILPSKQEKWGLVLNEALCSRLPVVCSDAVGGAEVLLQSGKNGWIFDSGNRSSLDKALTECVMNPDEVIIRGNNGYNFMRENWNYGSYKKALNELECYVADHKG